MKNIDTYLLYLFILVLPCLPAGMAIFPYSQIILAVSVILLILVIKIIKIIFTKKISFSIGAFDISVVLILASYFISTVFSTPNKMDAFITPGTTTLILIGSIVYFLVSQFNLEQKKYTTYFLFASVILYSIITLLSTTKIFPWITTTNDLIPILFIGSLIPIMISVVLKQRKFIYKFLIVISILIAFFTFTISIISNTTKYLSFKTSANIALSTLRKNPILGIGPGNYKEAFNKYRPHDYNLTELWSNKFDQGSSFLLTNMTEVGILGSVLFLALFAMFVNFSINIMAMRKKVGWGLLGSFDLLSGLISFIVLMLFPSYSVLIITFFIILGLISESKKHEYILPSKILAIVIATPMLILLLLASYKIYILSFAEYNYLQGMKSLSENKAKGSYDQFKKAISLNSKVDRYHKALSSVNFGVAIALSRKENLADTEKEQITLIVQESINEAKAAVALNNHLSENWQFLGKTYHLLVPFAKGADQFAIDSYNESINLDPINPNLRISLGEIYMVQKDYQNAIEVFKLAVLAKDDHPNAHFNLAIAYKENGQIEAAIQELGTTISLLDKDSEDYIKAKSELDKLTTP